jgi:uncharacterized coiled-coil protein SlyX
MIRVFETQNLSEEEFSMESFDDRNRNESEGSYTRVAANPWLAVVAIVLLIIAGISLTYAFHEQGQVSQLKEQTVAATSSMNQLQTQVSTLTAKLNDMSAAQTGAQNAAVSPSPSAAPAASTSSASEDMTAPATPAAADSAKPVEGSAKHVAAKHPAAKRHAPVDKRYAQLKTQLDEQQKQLKETQDEVAKNRTDLEGSISSTKDELNGSIAKTHEELVALEKRGERSYFEFDLSKSKEFQRFGPLTLSLRRVDTKHKNYDLAMIVDDNELTKKRVNLYEPIWIHTENGAQPMQVVVNRVEKNIVHGYVSAPKYKASELSALSPSAAPPASDNSQTTPQPQK